MRHGSPRLGVILETARLSRGMSVRSAAKAAGISAPFLLRLEQAQRRPSAAVAAELSRVYRLSGYEADILEAESVPRASSAG